MKGSSSRILRLRDKRYLAMNVSDHRLPARVYQALRSKRSKKQKIESQKVFTTSGRVLVTEAWLLKRLGLTKMVTLEDVSQIIEKTIHTEQFKKGSWIQSDDDSSDGQEELLQAAQIIDKVTSHLEESWQDLSIEEHETGKQLYKDLEPLVQIRVVQRSNALEHKTKAEKALCDALGRLINTLADAIEFECISSEVSDILSTPFTDDEIEKADAAIAKLTDEVNSQRYSSEETWTRFDAVRDKITSTTKPQNP